VLESTALLKACFIATGAHKRREAAPRSVQHRMITWNSDVLTLFGSQFT